MSRRERPCILATSIQKGGAGKTSLTLGLAGAWAASGYRVAVADFDPQCHATSGLLDVVPDSAPRVHEWLFGDVHGDEVAITSVASDRIRILPGTPEVDRWEALSKAPRERTLRTAREVLLERLPSDVDIVLIDTPPTLGIGPQFALASADAVLIPVKPEPDCVEGLGRLTQEIDWVRNFINPSLRIAGIIFSDVQAHTVLHSETMDAVRDAFPRLTLNPAVPHRIAIPESKRMAQPIEFYRNSPRDLRQIYQVLSELVSLRMGIGMPDEPKEVA